VIERQFERVAHVVADDGDRAAKRADEADLDRFVLGRSRTRCKQYGRACSQQDFPHDVFLPEAFFRPLCAGS
jgi:hypothetical protein